MDSWGICCHCYLECMSLKKVYRRAEGFWDAIKSSLSSVKQLVPALVVKSHAGYFWGLVITYAFFFHGWRGSFLQDADQIHLFDTYRY